MRKPARLLILALALLSPADATFGHSHRHKSIQVVHPWTEATPTGAARDASMNAAVFMKIRNSSPSNDRLISAASEIADKAEIVVSPDGKASSLPAQVVIPRKAQVDLTRSGPHVRLVGLKRRLDAYDSFKMTLVFERAGAMVVEVQVED